MSIEDDYQATVARCVELEEMNAKQMAVLKECAGLAARLEKAEDTILSLQEIAWSRIKLGGTAYTNAAVSRFQQMSNRLEAHRDLMEKKLASDDLARKLNGSHEG